MESIDTWNINRYICKALHNAKIKNSVARIVEIISPWIRLKFWLKFCFLITQMFLNEVDW